jgi:hypothetical protein
MPLTEKQRRKKAVAVAQDALAHLKLLTVAPGRYVSVDITHKPVTFAKSSKATAQALQKRKNCRVCALGACLLSTASLYNKFQFESLKKKASYGEEEFIIPYSELQYRLSEIFTQEQMDLIESAFEGRDMTGKRLPGRSSLPVETVQSAIAFGSKYDVPKARLRAIMKNIVKNDGEFRP